MSIRSAIERIALSDARRLETRIAAMLRWILKSCEHPETRAVLANLIAGEEEHLSHLDALNPTEHVAPETTDKSPDVRPNGDTVCDMLRDVLRRESAAVTFYELLAERTPVPPVKEVFSRIAAEEKEHVAQLDAEIRRLCNSVDPSD